MNWLKSSILLKTTSENKYLYDRGAKKFVPCPPILFYVLSQIQEGIDIEQWLDLLSTDTIDIENIGTVSTDQLQYYYKKYLLLKENGFFSTINQAPFINRNITTQDIQISLANARQVTLEAFDGCSLSCDYCGFGKFYNNYDKREDKFMDTETAFSIIDYLSDIWNSPLNRSHDKAIFLGFFGGEPLLASGFLKEVVTYAKKKKLKYNYFAFAITTNGLLLKNHLDFLMANQFHLLISLDGNEMNNSYRLYKDGTSSFKNVYDNVKFIQKNYPDYYRSHVEFNAVLHNRNSVSEIFHFFKNEFDKLPSIGPLNDSGIEKSQQKIFWETYANVVESLYSSDDYPLIEQEMFIQLSNIQSIAGFLHHITDFSFINYNNLFRTTNNIQPRLPSGTCMPFGKKIFVTVNGKILACEKIGHQFELGRVEDRIVSMNLELIAEKYNRWYSKIRTKCNQCYNVEQCTQCMFYLDLEEDELHCHGFMKYGDYAKRIASIIRFIEKRPDFYAKIFKKVRFS